MSSRFLNEIKKAILTSKQLEVKAESFSKLRNPEDGLKNIFRKEIDDFSFKVEDTIELELDFGEKEYSLNCLLSEEDLENDFYYFIVNEALKEVKFNDAEINYLFDLGVRNAYVLTFDFLIELKHSFDVEGFEVKKIYKSEIVSIQKFQKKLIQLRYKEPYDNVSYKVIGNLLNHNNSTIEELDNYDKNHYGILGYLSNSECSNILSKLKDDQKYLIDLENKIKTLKQELFSSPEQINGEKTQSGKSLSIKRCELVSQWLNENCKPNLRNLISVNPSCYYFSLSEDWLMPIDFLNSKSEYCFEAARLGT